MKREKVLSMTTRRENSSRYTRFMAGLRIFLGIDYRSKGNLYWTALAIPQLFFLIFALYITFMIMVRHVYGYFEPQAYFDFPASSILYYLAGEKTSEEQEIEKMGLESELIKSLFRTPSRTRYEHFHYLVDERPVGNDDLCFICHGDLPHAEDKKVRSTLNMHTEFTACITCHTTEEKAKERSYMWYNYSGIDVEGRPFGTRYNELGGLERTDDHYSKITPYREVDGQIETIGITEDSKEARDYLKVRERLTHEQQSIIKRKFHQDIEKEAIFCDHCHTSIEEGVIPFEELDFDEKRARELRSENLSGTVEPENEFYFPSILKEKVLLEAGERTLAPQAVIEKSKAERERKREESLNWWQKRYRAITKDKEEQ